MITLIAYTETAGLVDEGRVGPICLDFSKAFNTVSHNVFLEKKLALHDLDRFSPC